MLVGDQSAGCAVKGEGCIMVPGLDRFKVPLVDRNERHKLHHPA